MLKFVSSYYTALQLFRGSFLRRVRILLRSALPSLLLLTTSLSLTSCSRQSLWPQESEEELLASLTLGPQRLIVLDAGHGGTDPGTQNLKVGLVEKRLTLRLAKLVQSSLRRMGYKVFMTRVEDRFIELDDRIKQANNLKEPSLFVSLHFNAASSNQTSGIEIYYYQDAAQTNRSYSSKVMAHTVLQEMLEATRAKNRGVKEGSFRVIKSTKVPAILVEGGFLSNEGEGKKIADARYLETLAQAIARGLTRYEKKTRHLKYLR